MFFDVKNRNGKIVLYTVYCSAWGQIVKLRVRTCYYASTYDAVCVFIYIIIIKNNIKHIHAIRGTFDKTVE